MNRPARKSSFSCCWRIAGVPVAVVVRGADRSEMRLVGSLYDDYRTDPPKSRAPGSLRLNVTFDPHSDSPQALRRAGPLFRARQSGGGVFFDRFDFSGTLTALDGKGYDGRFSVTGPGRHAVESLIRVCVAHALAGEGKLLLHASAVQRGGRLHVFSGRSGAGKTTIARELNGGGAAVALDRFAIGIGRGGGVVGEGTPFSDDEGVIRRSSPQAVTGIYFIEQGSRDSIRLLDSHGAAKRLLRDGMPLARDRDRDERLLAVIEKISDAKLCYEVGFRRSEGYWKLIDQLTQ